MDYWRCLFYSTILVVSSLLNSTWATSPKVFDCFPFFNELDLLKVRLAELDEVVDYFVLVESVETQRGTVKPLYFQENRHLFGPYLHKIIHVALTSITKKRAEGDWWREHYQRNAIIKGLKKNCSSDDIVLISDLDEIPKKSSIAAIRSQLQMGAYAVGLHMDMFRHRMNWVLKEDRPGYEHWNHWVGTIGVTYATLCQHDPQHFRDHRGSWNLIPHGGWHFTSMGNNDAIRMKEYALIEGRENVSTDPELSFAFQAYRAVPFDSSYPEYVKQNYDYFVSIHFIDPSVPAEIAEK